MQASQNAENRIVWLDVLRTAAIFLVLLCHATESGVYWLDLSHFATYKWRARISAWLLFTLGRLGVPFFLMITGYLMLDRVYDHEAIQRFWKNRWLPLMLCTQVWFLLYDIFLKYYAGETLQLADIFQDVFFLRKLNMPHTWYMPMILGIYLLIPVVARGLRDVPADAFHFPVRLLFVLLFAFPAVCTAYTAWGGKNNLSTQIHDGFSGGYYGFYLLLGYLAKRRAFPSLKRSRLVLIAVISFALCVAFQLWVYSMGYAKNVWYQDPFLMIAALCLFLLASDIRTIPFPGMVRWLSEYAFGVYCIHIIFKYFLLESVNRLATFRPVKVLLLFAGMYVFSYATAALIGKIPRLGKFLLYLK